MDICLVKNGIEKPGSFYAICSVLSNAYYSSLFYLYQFCSVFFLSFELCVGVCAAWRLMYCVIYWGERTTCKLVLFFIHMEKSILSFYHVGFDDQTKVTRLADKHLYLQSCISTPLQFHFSYDSSVLPLSFRHNIMVESFQMWCSRGIPSKTSLFGKRFVKSY